MTNADSPSSVLEVILDACLSMRRSRAGGNVACVWLHACEECCSVWHVALARYWRGARRAKRPRHKAARSAGGACVHVREWPQSGRQNIREASFQRDNCM